MRRKDSWSLLGALLVDAGIAAGVLGILSLLRRRRGEGGALVAAGAVVGLAGVALPAPERRAEPAECLLDEIFPRWQFSEFHEIRVQAPPAAVYRAVREVRGDEIFLLRTLTWIRSPQLPSRCGRVSILNPGRDRPILDVAASSGFAVLAEARDREMVLGTCVVDPDGFGPRIEPAGFVALDAPGYVKAAVNFLLTDLGDGWTRLTTETRVWATDPRTRRRFAAYWRLIYPGSAFIRRMWLRAVARRAETAREISSVE